MRYFLFTLLAAGALVGCSDRPESLPTLRIVPTLSRVTGLNFDKGDRIGLTVTRTSGDYVVNRPLDYDGSVFKASGLTWYAEGGEPATLTAYYPYSEAGAPTRFTVAADQRSGLAASDLLGAVQRDVVPGSAPVGMIFYHLMSQVSIVVDNRAASPVTGITLGGVVAEADVDLSVPEAAAVADAPTVEIESFEVEAGLRYRAILVPQQAALTVEVELEDGTICSKTISEALLAGGKNYDLSVVVTEQEPPVIEVSLSGEIADWEDGGDLENPDSGTEDPTPSEGVDYAGEHYRTVTIGGAVWMADNLRYKPAEALLDNGLWYPYNEDADAVATKGYLYDYSVATGGTLSTTTPLRGICPEGWHIPDRGELQALLDSPDRPADFFCCAGYRLVTESGTTGGYGVDGRKGMLMGVSEGSTCAAIVFLDAADPNPSLGSFPTTYGMSLRCVKD